MKKRIISFALATLLCVSSLAVLTACSHEHCFSTDWSADATHHWHACEDASCTEVSDKAEHSFDGGKVTTEATDTADGVKTFTCTVCDATKTEPIAFNGLTAGQYGVAMDAPNFNNVTVNWELNVTPVSGDAYSEVFVVKMDGNKYSQAGTSNGEKISVYSESDAESVAELKATLLFFAQIKRKQLTFDKATGVYTAAEDCKVNVEMPDGAIQTFTDAKMKFSGNTVTEVTFALSYTDGGEVTWTATGKVTLSGYTTTVVVPLGLDADTLDAATNIETAFENVTFEVSENDHTVTVAIANGTMQIGDLYYSDEDLMKKLDDYFGFLSAVDSSKFMVDSEADAYVIEGAAAEYNNCSYSNVSITLSDGKLTYLTYICTDNASDDVIRVIHLSAYGETSVEGMENNGGSDGGDQGSGDQDGGDQGSGDQGE
ncbi:MAG: hypothetical protein IJY50_09320 [Clostridia bacterium]|nr:hypothetical protein [Clostridia bacterium]